MILSRKYAFICVVRRCSNKIGDVDVNYKLPDVLKDIENRSSQRIQAMTSNLENKIDSLDRMIKGELGNLSDQIKKEFGDLSGQVNWKIGNFNGQVKEPSISFGIFGIFVFGGFIIGIFVKTVYDDIMQKEHGK